MSFFKIKNFSGNWKIKMVYFDSDNPTNPKHVDHVAIAIDTDTSCNILETTAKNISDLNTWNLNSVANWWTGL